jgi:hypothetical protein
LVTSYAKTTRERDEDDSEDKSSSEDDSDSDSDDDAQRESHKKIPAAGQKKIDRCWVRLAQVVSAAAGKNYKDNDSSDT